jgi:hypothetical protein
MPSGKGKKCPKCGRSTFQPSTTGKLFRCSRCYFSGWTAAAPPKPGGGKGQFCHICKTNTLHPIFRPKVGDAGSVPVYFCKKCGATMLRAVLKRITFKARP